MSDSYALLHPDEEPDPAHVSPRERSPYVLRTIVALVLCVVGLGGLYVYTDDSTRWAARDYAKALLNTELYREECDAGLRVSRLGRGPAVSRALCVHHSVVPDLPKHGGNALKFLVIGDWGRDGMCCQRDVAMRMAEVTKSWSPSFVMNTGDNFYNHGIRDENDEQVATSWSDVYTLDHLKELKWVSVVGNHDHRGDVQAQLRMHHTEKLWHMPALTYFERRADVQFAYLDTTPMYYSRHELDHDFTGLNGTNFDDSDPQVRDAIERLEHTLAHTEARWKIVVGHHPLYSTGEHYSSEPENLVRMQTRLQSLFERHKVAAYICGHEHSLEHAVVNDVHYFVSGAGSKVREITGHEEGNRFAIGRQGFMAVAIERDSMAVYTIDMGGAILHTAVIPRPV